MTSDCVAQPEVTNRWALFAFDEYMASISQLPIQTNNIGLGGLAPRCHCT